MNASRLIAAGLALLLCSCVSYNDGFGGKLTSWGGSSTAEFPSGGRITHSHTRSFQHLTQAVTTIAGGIAVAQVQKANNAATAATNQQLNAQTAATAQAKIAAEQAAAETAAKAAATSEAIKAGAVINPITITPP